MASVAGCGIDVSRKPAQGVIPLWTRIIEFSTDCSQLLAANLKEADPAVYSILQKEERRQKHFINLIPSENFTSQAVLDALGSVMQSKHASCGRLREQQVEEPS